MTGQHPFVSCHHRSRNKTWFRWSSVYCVQCGECGEEKRGERLEDWKTGKSVRGREMSTNQRSPLIVRVVPSAAKWICPCLRLLSRCAVGNCQISQFELIYPAPNETVNPTEICGLSGTARCRRRGFPRAVVKVRRVTTLTHALGALSNFPSSAHAAQQPVSRIQVGINVGGSCARARRLASGWVHITGNRQLVVVAIKCRTSSSAIRPLSTKASGWVLTGVK
ncbi:uncharacterized protein LY79DRAFT_60917 [Colletotrichum navitas]|uniref:Uncharacterized protein n=1 Tax=Colletotrichum navitas TaxID=681940 RepID=A0AAD8Q6X2_9PEZI|nr:uncharacterized protein LY79DRAFT_60917 [Colletotrichum navitas]KAK1596308.1 hypothetical protein LY79DRAFT_60917 [Colletotrichum navitas]